MSNPITIDFDAGKITADYNEAYRYEGQLEDYFTTLKGLLTSTGMQTPVLPKNTKLYAQVGDTSYYVIELAPGRYPLPMAANYGDQANYNRYGQYRPRRGPRREFKYAMPWQYFVFQFTKTPPNEHGIEHIMNGGPYLYWSRLPLTSWSDRVVAAMVPNVYDSGLICLGLATPRSGDTITDKINQIVGSFYSEDALFNRDVTIRRPYGAWNRWAAATRDNVYCWRNWPELQRPRLQLAVPFNSMNSVNDSSLLFSALQQSAKLEWHQREGAVENGTVSYGPAQPIVLTNSPVTWNNPPIDEADNEFEELVPTEDENCNCTICRYTRGEINNREYRDLTGRFPTRDLFDRRIAEANR
jgi:hypothetical protein